MYHFFRKVIYFETITAFSEHWVNIMETNVMISCALVLCHAMPWQHYSTHKGEEAPCILDFSIRLEVSGPDW